MVSRLRIALNKTRGWADSKEREKSNTTHVLAIARLAFLALGAMHKGGGFCVEAVKAVGLLVDKGVILGHKLPANLRRHEILVDGGRGGRRRHAGNN